MLLLREEMERKRKQMIQQIENKKNAAIKDLTGKHAKKYNDIKNYYQEITNTNLDLVKQLKDELNEAKREDQTKQKAKWDQEEANKQVVVPLQEANEDVNRLEN
mmetsp:Transcript_17426/g.16621  ORF Transcript_17426/g.16621 Transcript_17426/m.16621 type:complete len:104 (-) Transcript_17426:512-823(-)